MQPENIDSEMTPVIKTLALAGFPAGSQIIQATSYRPDYQPFPMCVHVKIPSGEVGRYVVKFNLPAKMKREVLELRQHQNITALSLALTNVRETKR